MHSSPTVVDGQVYSGALYQLQSLTEGVVYCVNAADGRQAGDKVLSRRGANVAIHGRRLPQAGLLVAHGVEAGSSTSAKAITRTRAAG